MNLDKPYDGDQSFLHKLAKQQHTRLMENFIDLGVDVNAATNSDGSTAAHYIVQTGDSQTTRDIITLLIKHDADLTIKNDNEFSPLDLCGYRMSKFVQKLQDENPKKVSLYEFSKQDVKSTFNLLDRTQTGYVSIAEIRDTLFHLDLGFNVSDNLLDYMFRLCDVTGDGQISMHEFLSMVKHHINGVARPIHDDAKLAQLFRKKIEKQMHIRNVPLDFIFIPRNIENNIAAHKSGGNPESKVDNDDKSMLDMEHWVNIEPAHNLVDAASIAKILKKCGLNFTKLERLYQLYFTSTSAQIHHTYTKFEDFMKAFKNAESRYKKKLKRLFYTFRFVKCICSLRLNCGYMSFLCFSHSEEHTKCCNGRLLFICLAGILGQYATHFATLEELAKIRAEFVFKLLDVNNEESIDIFQIAWLLRASSLFRKTEDEVLRKAQLLLTASGAKGYGEQVQKESMCYKLISKKSLESSFSLLFC